MLKIGPCADLWISQQSNQDTYPELSASLIGMTGATKLPVGNLVRGMPML